MQKLPQPVKLWWYGPLFRHERPQAGRFRQFSQLDAEVIGSDSPLVDAELIVLLDELLRAVEVPELTLKVSSLGSLESRGAYRNELIAYLREHEDGLDADVRERIDENPLRAFDSKDPATQEVMAEAPKMLDHLDDEDAEHFETVKRLLDQAGVAYEVDATIVRGLDYYTRTVFEFHSARLGAQSQVAGGGRYDELIALFGGPRTPAIGWAAGVERILLAIEGDGEELPHDVFVAADDAHREQALALVTELRRAGLRADLDLASRSMKGQMRQADRTGAAARGDPRGRRRQDSRHGIRGTARGGGWQGGRGAHLGMSTEPGFPALRANEYRDAWCGQVLPERVGDTVRVAGWVHRRRDHGGLDLHRPARPHRAGAARLQPGRGRRRLRARPRAALRGRAHSLRRGGSPLGGDDQPRPSHRRGGGPSRGRDAARRRRHPAVRDRVVLRRGGGGGSTSLPVPRPAPGPHAPRDRAAAPRRTGDPRVLRRRGVRGHRDADALALHARGRPRLPGSVAARARARSTRCRSRRSSSSSS